MGKREILISLVPFGAVAVILSDLIGGSGEALVGTTHPLFSLWGKSPLSSLLCEKADRLLLKTTPFKRKIAKHRVSDTKIDQLQY